MTEQYSRKFVLGVVQELLMDVRSDVKQDRLTPEELDIRLAHLEDHLAECIRRRISPSLRQLVNATGVIVFTNAGRAPLAPELAERIRAVTSGYTNLEYDLERGTRGHRDRNIENRIKRLLECEAATVCNNAAAAVFLILNSLALGREVLVSRGELIEIGGSFRIPEIMEKSGAVLKEVGTTNKTKAADYESHIDEDTALILRVHQSNYRIVGFTHRPTLQELVRIAHRKKIPVVHDIGSGYLFRTDHPCLRNEPTVASSLSAGTDLICFSGDKLLGGPQAGVIIGRADLVERIRRNPLMRTFRVDKITYAALDWTLLQYEQGTFQDSLPVWQLISVEPDAVRQRARDLSKRLTPTPLQITLESGFSLTGGGSAPEEQIPTWLISIETTACSANQLEKYLRSFDPPILSRIEDDRVLLDLRTVFPEQDEIICRALRALDLSDVSEPGAAKT